MASKVSHRKAPVGRSNGNAKTHAGNGGANVPPRTPARTPASASAVVLVAKPTVEAQNGGRERIYDDAVNEIVSLAWNNDQAKKLEGGPLNEARGKDTWQLHAQLRAVDKVDNHLATHASEIQASLKEVDEHLQTNGVAIASLVERHGSDVARRVALARETLDEAITTLRGAIEETIGEARTSISKNTDARSHQLQNRLEELRDTVRESFGKLNEAASGSEKHLRSQTSAFSKAVETQLGSLRTEFDRSCGKLREQTARLEQRFSQTDSALASIRSEQEIIKTLLSDIVREAVSRPAPPQG